MLANVAEQASAIVYLVLSMVAGFLLVELGLWLGGRLMRSHMEAADAREK
jgi:fluoride ion exporter CrcB/FEX